MQNPFGNQICSRKPYIHEKFLKQSKLTFLVPWYCLIAFYYKLLKYSFRLFIWIILTNILKFKFKISWSLWSFVDLYKHKESRWSSDRLKIKKKYFRKFFIRTREAFSQYTSLLLKCVLTLAKPFKCRFPYLIGEN